MSLLFAVLSGYALALAAPPVARRQPRAAGWILALLPLTLFGYFLTFIPVVIGGQTGGQTVQETVPWVPSLGINLSFTVDGLSLLFALLITGIGALVVIYAGGYLHGHRRFSRFFAYFFLFMASMLGVVLADNVIALFVFWELTSVSSYLLIGFERERESARKAALQALLVTGLGGLALLAGLLLLGQMGGGLELSAIAGQGEAIRGHALYLPALLLILLGAFTKSAQFPFHFWLPNAMEAPTPVSAYLHSATMVKAGIYLMARLNPTLGGTEAWQAILMAAGGATMLVGAYLALAQTDLKRVLAYSTVSSLGTLTFLLGVGSQAAMLGAMAFLLAHALYKGALFLVTGAIDHETGTRDVRLLGGLRQAMPVLTAAAILACCSMAGLPFFWGFIGKETFYGAVLGWEGLAPAVAAVLTGVSFVAVAGVMATGPFFGASKSTAKHAHEAPVSLWLGPMCLGATDLVFGLLLGSSVESFLTRAAEAISLPGAGTLEMELWHPPGTALLLSGISWAAGAAIVWKFSAVREAISRAAEAMRWGPSEAYEAALAGLNGFARLQTRILQSGSLRYYFLIIVGTFAGLTGYVLTVGGGFVPPVGSSTIRFHEGGVAVLILASAIVAARATSRLAAITALGVTGYGVALIYILYGAPDLAMTQFMVETLTVILLLLVFYHLPHFSRLRTPAGRFRDLAASLAAGAIITALVLTASAQERVRPLTEYFAENSFTQGHGRNIVNVILVDFRGLDTMGEITVLGVAGVGIYALLKLRLPGRSSGGRDS
jgi:multicomponent Na+:H+ antiporter subunit A